MPRTETGEEEKNIRARSSSQLLTNELLPLLHFSGSSLVHSLPKTTRAKVGGADAGQAGRRRSWHREELQRKKKTPEEEQEDLRQKKKSQREGESDRRCHVLGAK